MTIPVLMPQYHDAVIGALKSIEWVKDADAYPEKDVPRYSGLVTPAVYFTVNGWENVESNEDQTHVELSCDLFVVVDSAGASVSKPEIYARAAAADLTQWLNGQQFGLTQTEPARFTAAERDEFDPRMDDYLVWRVSYSQVVAFGRDPFEPATGRLKEVWLGISPDIGRQHVDDYTLIYEAHDEQQ